MYAYLIVCITQEHVIYNKYTLNSSVSITQQESIARYNPLFPADQSKFLLLSTTALIARGLFGCLIN